jgi:hypothetical protein
MYVNATTTTTGTATVENVTTGKQASIDLTSTSALGGQNAEWIVEDFQQNNELVAFADFGTVKFTGCVAKTSESSEGIESAGIMAIENTDMEILTEVSVASDSEFAVTYTAASASATSSATTPSATDGSGSSPGSASGGGSGRQGENGKGSGNGPFGSFRRWISLFQPVYS